jgi:sugar phosphate isomerase/epimerase
VDQIGIEHISTFGMPPVELVGLAADLECAYIGIALLPINDYNPHGYRDWSLRDDAGLRRETLAAMRDRGVSIALAGGFHIWPGREAGDLSRDLDLFCELGAEAINTSGYDPDVRRCFDQFGLLAELAAARGLPTMLEFGPEMAVADLATALAAQRHVGRSEFRLLIDTMHFVRTGGSAADLAALDPDLIGYVQLCDAPLVRRYATHMEEAKYERMIPGAGELPLFDVMKALPPGRVVGLEIPIRSAAEAGVGPHERLGRCVAAARSLLAQSKGERS